MFDWVSNFASLSKTKVLTDQPGGMTKLLPMQFVKIANVKMSLASSWPRSFPIGLEGKGNFKK